MPIISLFQFQFNYKIYYKFELIHPQKSGKLNQFWSEKQLFQIKSRSFMVLHKYLMFGRTIRLSKKKDQESPSNIITQ